MANRPTQSVFITGANGGMGKATVKLLLQDGCPRIVMAGRSETKLEQARAEVLADTGAPGTAVQTADGFDMTDPDRIAAAVAALPADRPFDVIFVQAGGVVFGKDYRTVEHAGQTVETTAFQNVIGGHVTLAELRKRGLVAPGARVVVAGGEGARGIPGLIPKPTFASPQALCDYLRRPGDTKGRYNPMAAIGVSKLLSALWVRKLAELEGSAMTTVWFSPGLTYGTDGLADKPPVQRWFLEHIVFGMMRLFGKAQSPEAGARKYTQCLQGAIGDNGAIIGAPEGKALGELVDQVPMNDALSDDALRDAFWDFVQSVVGPWPAPHAVAVEPRRTGTR